MGNLSSKPNKTYTVQFFSNSAGTNEGKVRQAPLRGEGGGWRGQGGPEPGRVGMDGGREQRLAAPDRRQTFTDH